MSASVSTGVIVTVDHAGELRIERGLIRKEDVKKLPKAQGGETGLAGSGQSEAAKPVHSEKLTRMLTAHRSAAIQAEIMNRPEIALAALVHQLALQVFGSGYRTNRIVQVNIEQTYLKKDAENIGQSRAAIAIEEKRGYWTDRIEAAGQGGKTLFGWLLEQDLADLRDLMAFCTAVSINTGSGRENAPSDDVAAISAAPRSTAASTARPRPGSARRGGAGCGAVALRRTPLLIAPPCAASSDRYRGRAMDGG